jgi:hypothetical protein
MRLTNKIRYLLCSAKFEGTPIRRSRHAHTHVLLMSLSRRFSADVSLSALAVQGMPRTHTRSLLMSLSRVYRCFRGLDVMHMTDTRLRTHTLHGMRKCLRHCQRVLCVQSITCGWWVPGYESLSAKSECGWLSRRNPYSALSSCMTCLWNCM